MYEITREFRFDAAHSLQRQVAAEGSRRIHGHSYRAEVTLRGEPDPATGMVMDLGLLAQRIETVRVQLDHHLLDEVQGLGPATMENLCAFIWSALASELPAMHSVAVLRDSTVERVVFYGGR